MNPHKEKTQGEDEAATYLIRLTAKPQAAQKILAFIHGATASSITIEVQHPMPGGSLTPSCAAPGAQPQARLPLNVPERFDDFTPPY